MPIDLSVVIPAYREAARLGPTLERVLDYLDGRRLDYEVLVVDDGSPDDTARVAEGFAERGVRTLRLPENAGKGAALRHGVLESRGRRVLVTDADLSAPIEDLERLEAAAGEAELVYGSRSVADSEVTSRQPRYRELMGKSFNLAIRALGLTRLRDTQCGFKLLDGEVARELFGRLTVARFAYDVELAWLARERGYQVAEVGVRWQDSPQSTVHPVRDAGRMLWDVVRLRLRSRRDRPGAAARRSSPRALLLLGLLLLWSLALRAWLATPELNAQRFWDERYGLENIQALLTGGGLRPANGFHPSLSYLPQAAVLAASDGLHRLTGADALAIFGRGGFTPTAYLLCRLTQALLGGASLLLVFLVGRRLADEWVGLAAALLLAVVPWHVRQSVIYKPDILLTATLLAAFLLSLRAAARPSLRTYLSAGGAIGLALASKFNAGPIAIPLAVAAAFEVRRRPRVLLWLAAAGLAAVAVFLALNPYFLLEPEIFERSMGRTLRDYARKGHAEGIDSRWLLPAHALSSLLSRNFHGPAVGLLGLAGAAVATLAALASPASARSRGWLMALSYGVGYVALYALSTSNPSEHNWLVLCPFVALGAAWLGVGAWRALRRTVAPLRRPAVAAGTLAALVALLAWPAQAYVYRSVVPTTGDLAGRLLASGHRDMNGRIVYTEVPIALDALRRASGRAVPIQVPALSALTEGRLELADMEIFLARRLAGPEADFYRRRMADGPSGEPVRLSPRLFRVRGPPVVVLLHPWQRRARVDAGSWERDASPAQAYRSDGLAGLPQRRVVSLEFWLPLGDGTTEPAAVRIGDRRLASVPHRLRPRRVLHATPRFRVGRNPRLTIEPPAGTRPVERIHYVVHQWRPSDRGRPESPRGSG